MTLETVETDIPASFATSDIVANFYHLLAFVPYKPYITPDALLLQVQNWYRFHFCQNHTNSGSYILVLLYNSQNFHTFLIDILLFSAIK